VIPPKLWESILQALHAPHPGIVKMKSIARSYVWCPNMDDEIEVVVKKCGVCQQNRNEEPKTDSPLGTSKRTKVAPAYRLFRSISR